MVRFNYRESTAVNSISVGDRPPPRTTNAVSNNGTEEDSIHFLTSQWTSSLSPNVVSQLRFTFTREIRPRTPNVVQPSVSTAVGAFGTRSYLPTTELDVRPFVKHNLMVMSGIAQLEVRRRVRPSRR